MKRVMPLIVIVMFLLAGCDVIDPVVPIDVTNEAPIVGCYYVYSPDRHGLYDRDIYGTGSDLDGEIVYWEIVVNGERFIRYPDPENPSQSSVVTYHFPQAGRYPLEVTAFDDDGASDRMIPWPDGKMEVR